MPSSIVTPELVQRCVTTKLVDGRHDMRESVVGNVDVIFTYKSIDVKQSDYLRLNEGEMLNDIVIDFYLEQLKDLYANENVHIFHSTFFPLMKKDVNRCAQRMPGSTIKLFEKELIMFPINHSLHWVLIAIYKPYSPMPRLIYCDSLGGDGQQFIPIIREYMQIRWGIEATKTPFIDFLIERAELPLQQNYVDCGVFMLHYVYMLIRNRSRLFFPIKLRGWFTTEDIQKKRKEIKSLMNSLRK